MKNQNNENNFLNELLDHYVNYHGLGGMAKSDFDALIIYLYIKYKNYDPEDLFTFSKELKIKESRLKSLIETAFLKFGTTEEDIIYKNIIVNISKSKIELESLEKGLIRVKLSNGFHIRFIQNLAREYGSTVEYNRNSEKLIVRVDIFTKIIEYIYQTYLKEDSSKTIEKIFISLKENALDDAKLKEAVNNKNKYIDNMFKSIETGSGISSIFQAVFGG